jgi:hypothetical protein
MRLIDADQMAVDESEAYMSAQVQITDDLKWLVNFAAHSKIQKLIADTPTVDAVPVVRCKDCKHYDMGVCLKIYSDGNVHPEAWQSRRPDDFCSYGERKNVK